MYHQDIYYIDKKTSVISFGLQESKFFLSNTKDSYTSPHGVEPQSEALLGDSVLDKFTVKGQGHEVWTVFGACPLVANYIPATSTWIKIRRIYFFPISFPSEFM